jgi:hypothetical protein
MCPHAADRVAARRAAAPRPYARPPLDGSPDGDLHDRSHFRSFLAGPGRYLHHLGPAENHP